MTWTKNDIDFQTPDHVCDYMVSIAQPASVYLEPSPGAGNIVRAIKKRYPIADVVTPEGDFLKMEPRGGPRCTVIMNPPFTPMKYGYQHLMHAMKFSQNIVALLPMFILINSIKRTSLLFSCKLNEVILLPRTVFRNTRIQTALFVFSVDQPVMDVTLSYYDPSKKMTSFAHPPGRQK